MKVGNTRKLAFLVIQRQQMQMNNALWTDQFLSSEQCVCLLTLNNVPAYELFRSHQYILATDNNVDYTVIHSHYAITLWYLDCLLNGCLQTDMEQCNT